MKRTIIAFLLIAVLAMACAPTDPGRDVTTTGTYTPSSTFDPESDVRPTNFRSMEEFEAFVSVGSGGFGGVGFDRFAMAESAPMMADAAVSSKGGAAGEFSTTNNQVAGVDEADIVKTDGEYIYTVTGTTLFIISAGEDAQVIEAIELDSAPTGLFVQGNKLAVFGNFYDIDYFRDMGFVPRRGGMTYFDVYDISDREEPKLLEEYKFEGTYFQARMYGDHVYFVVTSFPDGRGEYPTPIIIQGETVKGMDVSDIYRFPVPYDSVQLATVHSIDLKGLGSVSSKAIAVEWGNQLYMSEENIYITTTENINEWEIRQEIIMELLRPKLTAEDKSLIERIERADNDVLSQAEKKQKIYEVYASYYEYMKTEDRQDFDDQVDKELKQRMEEYDALTYTIINRMSVDDGTVTVEATGKVPGSLNNQFAMDEYDGHLRVATTIQPRWSWWGRPMPVDIAVEAVDAEAVAPDEPVAKMMPPIERSESTNNVYVLDMGMEIVGDLTGLAKGEQIYSTRFMGERLYMVTFRQVDPFFAIDLSDPTDPKEMGQLKIPGFSRYLHPYDENIIIGIGRDATDMGRQQGLKISLFDVTNPEKPVELAKWVADDEYSQSAAEYEHKAFLFDKEKELLVIPAYSYSWDYNGGSRNKYNGAMVFRITAEDIEMRGIIDHGTKSEYYGPSVERSLWIKDLLYTKSPNLLRVNEISDLDSVKNVTLTSKGSSPYPVY